MAAKKKGKEDPKKKRPAEAKGPPAPRSKRPTSRPSAAASAAPVSSRGFLFANPSVSPDDFDAMDPKDILADTKAKASDTLEPIPPPRKPGVLSLDQVLNQADVKQIEAAGKIVFHCVGDTGGVKEPSKQFAVADAMVADLAGKTYQTGRPAFFYHLGDVVYYLGQDRYYYDQFYDPYRDYDAPIFAIPGNHDGMVSSSVPQTTLQGFLENFCTPSPMHNEHAHGMARTTMIQPGAYFTLDGPFVKFIGLYSNIGEGTTQGVISGPKVGSAQLDFLEQELKRAAAQRKQGTQFALILAVHHPPFTGSKDHAPSPQMLKQIDRACDQANILPDLVLSGHAHLYERFTRSLKGNEIPYVVAGMGGYFNLSGVKQGKKGNAVAKLAAPVTGTDADGNKLTLETYNDTTFGFLRLAVSASEVSGLCLGVDLETKAISRLDTFTVDLTKHKVLKAAASMS